jgi:hypothetical protein
MAMRVFQRWCGGVLVLALTAAGSGCGGTSRLYKVEGLVTIDGNPVQGATVVFMPDGGGKGQNAQGFTDKDGRFTLKTNGVDGIEAGSYKVLVTKADTVINPDEGGGDAGDLGRGGGGQLRRQMEGYYKKTSGRRPKQLLPPLYADVERTPFHYTIPVQGSVTLELHGPGK